MAETLDDYCARHERIADEKAEDAPASADMHRAQAQFSRKIGRPMSALDWPQFNDWIRDEWSID